MPLNKKKTKKAFQGNVAELIRSFKKSGKIGKSNPSSMDEARKQALAIAFKIKRGGK
jgi:hypothetical protein